MFFCIFILVANKSCECQTKVLNGETPYSKKLKFGGQRSCVKAIFSFDMQTNICVSCGWSLLTVAE